MATIPKKAETKRGEIAFLLNTTRLIKLSVEGLIPSERAGNGSLHLTFRPTIEHILEKKNIAVLRLSIKGSGMSGHKDTLDEAAFTIDALIEGCFSFSRKPGEAELKAQLKHLANYLLPVLVDMIETLLAKCGYSGTLPRNIENKSA